ncbi:glycerophosphodiester phosphodiesterase [Desulfoplanes formicivorans]|uniref:Glycerophosphoryl diester phosphodiesterase n=1 Tax=Desulfoplanes formicivorans TaxID=1592317 RepID=A0A194AG82_9BACT|nr:glycerophosphodiester phosphodiesterase family protein [Desulfoplanes formicivorans]GAU08333.1 glycerophosphoryl diester phosphodiesterase [Desulfoplanes formicivorans]
MFFDAYTGSVLALAHRGARSLAPENTLSAVQKALDAGAYAWETDVQMSRDGHLVLTHDNTLSRVTNVARLPAFAARKPWRVADFTLEELRGLDFGSFFVDDDPFEQVAAGAFSGNEILGFRNMILPTLEEGLRFTREHNFRINVEIKDLHGTPGHDVVVEKVVEMVRHLDLVDQILISSFNFDYLQRVRLLMPEIPTAALMEAANLGEGRILETLVALGVQAWHPDREILQGNDLRQVLGEGMYVNVWTVNDPREMRSLVVQGVTGLITDFPQIVRAAAD